MQLDPERRRTCRPLVIRRALSRSARAPGMPPRSPPTPRPRPADRAPCPPTRPRSPTIAGTERKFSSSVTTRPSSRSSKSRCTLAPHRHVRPAEAVDALLGIADQHEPRGVRRAAPRARRGGRRSRAGRGPRPGTRPRSACGSGAGACGGRSRLAARRSRVQTIIRSKSSAPASTSRRSTSACAITAKSTSARVGAIELVAPLGEASRAGRRRQRAAWSTP